jgi:four helix bundle protein
VVDIEERTLGYALRSVKLYQYLQSKRDGAGWIIGKQFLRSATSIGANVSEAQSGESRADFIHKYAIAQKEARESNTGSTSCSAPTWSLRRNSPPLFKKPPKSTPSSPKSSSGPKPFENDKPLYPLTFIL